MDKECGWCGHEFEDMDTIYKYKEMYFCDEDCLCHQIGAILVVFYKEEVE